MVPNEREMDWQLRLQTLFPVSSGCRQSISLSIIYGATKLFYKILHTKSDKIL